MKRIAMLVLFGVVIGFAPMTGFAQQGKGPCAQDREKFCKDIKPGAGGLAKCLKEHESELSDACKQRMQEAQARRQNRHQACKADIEKFCSAAKPGRGELMKCLKEHEADLSADCKASLSQRPRRAN